MRFVQRPLEFRVYSRRDRDMIYSNEADAKALQVTTVGDKSVQKVLKPKNRSLMAAQWLLNMAAINGWPVMQWTGLKDKHGTKIFEGDIVQTYDYEQDAHTYNPTYRQPVEFRDGAFVLGVTGFPISELDDFDKYEVVGNIFRHKKLLKQP
jgi:uncharacterized phage protein (TIGR01671 family)